MGFKCGIVGLPNVGKSTLFNALTQSNKAEAANYPFATIEPNIGRVAVPDDRLDKLAIIGKSEKIIPSFMDFVDIAGLVKGASQGEGLGNKFLGHVREVDAIAHVVRCFEDTNITHVSSKIDPLDDIETINLELQLADLESLNNKKTSLEKKLKANDKEAKHQFDIINKILQMLDTNSILFSPMELTTPAQCLILAAFLVNAGAPPISSWLPDAYPESSPAGMVFLSAFTTKTAVYVILRSFAGEEVLIYFGLFMIFYGIIYALLENDMRRILAYSIVNQVGFMITAAGIGTQLAINGAAAHAFCHILYKALLLMSAGAVLHMTNKRKCTDLGGLYKTMPITAVCGIIGALSISAFPLTSGFISKSMVTESASIENLSIVWYLLVAASAGVFLHAGIKFPWFVFFQKDSGLRSKDPSFWMCLPMLILASLCILIGIIPQFLYNLLPYTVGYEAYTGTHIGTQFQLLLFSGLAFFMFLPQMRRTLTITLDTDWFYRRATLFITNSLLFCNSCVSSVSK